MSDERGIALMEVVAALSIFFIAAVFVMDGLNASLRAVHRARVEADAADLAVTVLSDVQLGQLKIKSEPPKPVDEKLFPGWTWELAVSPVDDLNDVPLLKRVEVIIRNTSEKYTYRMAQLVWDDPAEQSGGGGLDDAMQDLNLFGDTGGLGDSNNDSPTPSPR